ncbi:ParM/StbA family protein [Bacillus cereus]|uniref:ParM/StbA family protein n=1 Tax=Bacillus cereus TaxID=1396 RepID=UPI0018F77095|nr:ParM/StbA family protein [Bacillus cereus]MBJ8025161.1 ParM/StbA family protein [Bacillus cereus]MBJ8037619.1 ParM/StbA family protein [Bacillus cereus]
MLLGNPYAIDLGNGFTKRASKKKKDLEAHVVTELSVLAPVDDYYNEASFTQIELINTGIPYYIGEEARQSKLPLIRALGENKAKRYEDPTFKKQLFGFIAKDFKKSVTIPLLITGLPVSHFGNQREVLEKIVTEETVVKVNGELITIKVKKCLVIPQPVGTQYYLVKKEIIKKDDRILIIDGGFGTLDVTDMSGNSVIGRLGTELGCEKAFLNMEQLIRDHIGETPELSVSNMHYILQNGYKYNGTTYNLYTDKDLSAKVDAELQQHFQTVLREVAQKFNFAVYDKIIWTGGMASLHAKRIAMKQEQFPTFEALQNGQEANLLGYYYLGCDVFDKLTKEKAAN